jgi:hypothetical protein
MGQHRKADGAKRKEKYARQVARTEANKKRKLAKHIKNHPNDGQARG